MPDSDAPPAPTVVAPAPVKSPATDDSDGAPQSPPTGNPKPALAEKSSAKGEAVKRAPAEKSSAKGEAVKRAPSKKASPKGATVKRAPAKKVPAKRRPAKKAPAKKVARRSASRARRGGAKRTRRTTKFKVGDKVVHPHHGAAVITRRVEDDMAGENRSYFELQIATEQLTVFVPVDTIGQNIRPVISKTAAGKVLRIFKEDPPDSGGNWSRWYKVLNEKMTSGDITQVAEVVRDLTMAQHTKGISPALKRMLSRAKVTLTSELAFAFGIDQEAAAERLERALPVPTTTE